MKIIFADERPFWFHEEIFIECHSGYGFPSTHSLEVISFYCTICNIFCNYMLIDEECFIYRIIMRVFCLVMVCLICYSRILFALHSIDQVFFGLCYGFAIYFYFNHIKADEEEDYYAKKMRYEQLGRSEDEEESNNDNNNLYNDINNEIDLKISEENKNKKSNKKHKILTGNYFVDMTFILFATLAFSIITYFVFRDLEMDEKSSKVGEKYNCQSMGKSPSSKAFCVSLNFFGYFGTVYGYLFTKLYTDYHYEFTYLKIIAERESLIARRFVLIFFLVAFYFLANFLFNCHLAFYLRVVIWSSFFSFVISGPLSIIKLMIDSIEDNNFSSQDIDVNYNTSKKSNYNDDEEKLQFI